MKNNPHTCARQVTDPHLDAKVFPCAHPYGTGSVRSGATSIQPQRVCRNRLLSLQSFYRRSSRYAFWNLDMMLKRKLLLFFQPAPRTVSSQAGGSFLGRQIHPSLRIDHTEGHPGEQRVVEGAVFVVFAVACLCTRGAKVQSRELASICDDGEQGLHLCARRLA